jgi:putative glycosyltransferase (TIGR04372 family)
MKSLRKHLEEIRQGGITIVQRKARSFLLRKILVILMFPGAITVGMILRLLQPWVHFRFGYFTQERIGHFAIDVGLALAESELQSKNSYSDWYVLSKESSNLQWLKMVERNFRVPFCEVFFQQLIKLNLLEEKYVKHPARIIQGSRDIRGLLSKTSKRMPFLQEEENEAKTWLRKHGWKDGLPFVCLLVRDSAYLIRDPMHKWTKERCYYHNYRDSDIVTYVQAAEYLAEQDIWVLRMGKIAEKPIPSQHPKIIDYAFHSDKSDLLDIWLFANCNFCISTGSGPDAISNAYQRPMLMVNLNPISNINSWSHCITIPKHLVWKKSGKFLTLREHLQHNYHELQKYEQAGISFKDLSSQEITEAVKERLERLNGTWIEHKEDIDLQNRFWDQFKAWPDFSKYHDWIHPQARVGSHFLRKMGDAFYN